MINKREMAKIHKDKGEKVPKEPFYFLKWILKVEIIILLIYFIIGIIFNSISDKSKFVIKYNIEKNLKSNVKNEDYTYEAIIVGLNKNRYLKNEEKEFIEKILKPEIEENKDYIDIKEIVKRLKKLKVCYNKKYYYDEKSDKYKFKNNNVPTNIAGNYNSLLNKIDVYEQIDEEEILNNYEEKVFDFSSVGKEIYFHELNHLMSKNSLSTIMDTFARNLETKNTNKVNFLWNDISNSIKVINKNIFYETINELFTREYFEQYSKQNDQLKNYEAYDDQMVYMYGLAEILPAETLRKYKFYDNLSILVSGLLEIDNNIDKVYELISSINSVSLTKNVSFNSENYRKIHDGYAYFYEKKYNKNMSDDLSMLLYFYGTPIQNEKERDKIRSFLGMESYDEIIEIIPKGYVSKKYKENHKGIQVEYTKDGEKEFIEI